MLKTTFDVVKTRSDVVKISSDVVFSTSDVVKFSPVSDVKTSHIPFTMKKIAEKQKKYFPTIRISMFFAPENAPFLVKNCDKIGCRKV